MIAYSFHPEADAELAAATLYYESRRSGLGRLFSAEVERTISLVRDFPDSGAPVGASLRRVLVARYPYSILYRHNAGVIEILAIAHQRRRPGYWRGRK